MDLDPDGDAAPAVLETALDAELRAWAAAGRRVSIWWRDDDAARPTAALDRLLGLSAATHAPLALAVVPSWLAPGLAPRLAAFPRVSVLQHGFAHINHAKVAGQKGACEIGLHRGRAAVRADLAAGRARLEAAFGAQFAAVLVPPWNRSETALLPDLVDLGYAGLSAFGPRPPSARAAALIVNNCHCDPVDWKRGETFRGTARTLAQFVGNLAARRTGAADPAEATGLLTHHLDMDEATWTFTERLVEKLASHPAVRWCDAREVFAS